MGASRVGGLVTFCLSLASPRWQRKARNLLSLYRLSQVARRQMQQRQELDHLANMFSNIPPEQVILS